jgi:hypothetical protein
VPSPQVIVTPESGIPQLTEALMETQRILTRGLGLGDAGTGLALPRTAVGTTRPITLVGLPDNVFGSFVEVTLDLETAPGTADLNVNLQCTHNLNLPVPASRPGRDQRLNVRWFVTGVRYLTDNYADLAATDYRVLVLYADGAVEANSIELRFYTNLPNNSVVTNQALTITMFMFPAST